MIGEEQWHQTTCAYGGKLGIGGMPIPDGPEELVFGGWYTRDPDPIFVYHGMTVTSDMTAYATWKTPYTVTFDANDGGVSPTSATTNHLDRLFSLPTPTRSSYTFNGWFTAADGGTLVTTATVFSSNTTIFAQWTLSAGSGVSDKNNHSSTGHFCTSKCDICGRCEDELCKNYCCRNKCLLLSMNFTDVAEDTWCSEAIRWAAAEGIVNGYGVAFGPNDRITRQQFAAILWRYANYKDFDVSVGEDTNILSYYDAFDVAEYAIPAMQWACGEGLIQGNNGYLMPRGNATRVHAAAILQRFCENVVEAQN